MELLHSHLDNLYQNMYIYNSSSNTNALSTLDESLSNREQEISGLLCVGLSPAEISDKLCICVSTIYRHIANIHLKLNVSSRQELILKLIKSGFSPPK